MNQLNTRASYTSLFTTGIRYLVYCMYSHCRCMMGDLNVPQRGMQECQPNPYHKNNSQLYCTRVLISESNSGLLLDYYQGKTVYCIIRKTTVYCNQGGEPKMKNGSVGFSVFHQNGSVSVGFENETETERFSVGFSVGFSVKPAKKSTFQRIQCACVGIAYDDRIVWCQEQTKSYTS